MVEKTGPLGAAGDVAPFDGFVTRPVRCAVCVVAADVAVAAGAEAGEEAGEETGVTGGGAVSTTVSTGTEAGAAIDDAADTGAGGRAEPLDNEELPERPNRRSGSPHSPNKKLPSPRAIQAATPPKIKTRRRDVLFDGALA